ncbi:MAG TPA: type IV pilin N-terminal domain-containing protein [Methanocorpusculum sp.]|nr:type IV pilin N-terminal domain-containing protein [Methanocorpusculum sp.]
MKQNRCRKQTGNSLKSMFRKKDDGVSSVVGEMLLLSIGVILVAVFAVSLISLLPGDRDDHVDVAMNPNTTTGIIEFYHKGGDAISNSSLRVQVYGVDDNNVINVTPRSLTNVTLDGKDTFLKLFVQNSSKGNSSVFDIGCVLTVNVTNLTAGDQVRLMTEKTIIYTGVVKE